MKYLVNDNCLNFSFECNSEEEVMEKLGYEVGEITFEDLMDELNGGDYDIDVIEE
jgi:hypothetical protein